MFWVQSLKSEVWASMVNDYLKLAFIDVVEIQVYMNRRLGLSYKNIKTGVHITFAQIQ